MCVTIILPTGIASVEWFQRANTINMRFTNGMSAALALYESELNDPDCFDGVARVLKLCERTANPFDVIMGIQRGSVV